MFTALFKRLRRQKSQQRGVLVPPDLSLRDSFGSSFPHVSDGGYRRYYERQLLNQKRSYAEARNLSAIHAYNSTAASSSSHSQTQTPGASSSRSRRAPPLILPLPPTSRRAKSTRLRRAAPVDRGLARIPEVPPGPLNHHSVRKEKKGADLHTLLKEDGIKINASPFPSPKYWVTSQSSPSSSSSSSPSSSSSGHSMVDTPPTTVEDLALGDDEEPTSARGNTKAWGDGSEHSNWEPYERPGSRSSYHTARSDLNDPVTLNSSCGAIHHF